jgi:hypothetical protein
MTYPHNEDDEATGIICKIWDSCPHPELCQEKCIDVDIDQNYTTNENGQVTIVNRGGGILSSVVNFTGFDQNEED